MKTVHRHPSSRRLVLRACALLTFAIGLAALPVSAATITIRNADGNLEGFNDPKPVAPVGGNPGTTLGAQRLFLFQYAADAWAVRLGGNVPVVVMANFEPLGGTSVSATLGFAAPTTVHRDFLHAPVSATWYVAGLANQLYGTDLNDLSPQSCPVTLVNNKCPDLFAQFNSDVDNQTVLGAVDFYYGIDGNGGSDIDFLSVVLHEIGHGLGLLDLIDPATGLIDPNPSSPSCNFCSDAYTNNLVDQLLPVSSMTNAQRKAAILHDGTLVWAGPAVKMASEPLTAGVKIDGSVQIFAPATYQPGSSVSHLDTDVTPSELMEPYSFTPPPRDLNITLAQLDDLGWTTFPVSMCGDANDSKSISTVDAQLILKGAVGSGVCSNLVCNVNLAGGVTTTDALIVLRRAVGQVVALKCPLA